MIVEEIQARPSVPVTAKRSRLSEIDPHSKRAAIGAGRSVPPPSHEEAGTTFNSAA